MGGQPVLREGFTTDNGNLILDCHGLTLLDPPATGSRAQPDRRRGDQRHLRAPAGRRAAAGRGFGRKDHQKEPELGRAVFLLSLAAFASAASLRATDPLLPQIADDYGVTTGAASAAVTAFALSYGLLQVVCGPLGDRYGRYRTIAAAALVRPSAPRRARMAPTLDALIAARFVSGATIGAFIPLALAWIGDTVAYEQRQPMLARFLVGQMVGVAFGNAAAGWLGEHFGWRAIFCALAALLLVIALLFLVD